MVENLTPLLTIVALIVFIVVRERQTSRMINDLTIKLMSRDVFEYARLKKDLEIKPKEEPKKERKKVSVDPILGSTF